MPNPDPVADPTDAEAYLPRGTLDDSGDLTDLLSELRVLLPSAQLLSAFLITVPFNPGFAGIVASEKLVFLATFVLALTSLVLFSAPAVQHRVARPLTDRAAFKRLANRQIVIGAATLSLALVLGTELVLSEVFGHAVGVGAAAFIAVLIASLWWIMPKYWHSSGRKPLGRFRADDGGTARGNGS